jgi:hypothetical protein
MFRSALLLFSILASSVAANASVVYDFSDPTAGLSFTATIPPMYWTAFETYGYMEITPDDGLGCSPATCEDVLFLADASLITNTPSQLLIWESSSGGQVGYYFAPDTFTTNGTHDSTSTPGAELTVTGAADTAVPEPATFGLLVAPLAAAFAFRRRR